MIDLNNLSDYKGIFLIAIVLISITYYAKDLESILLFTGIIVNIIAIVLNTGVTKFIGKDSPNTFLPPKRYDLVEKYKNETKIKPPPPPPPSPPKPKSPPKEEAPRIDIAIAGKYKGAVDYENDSGEQYPQTSCDGLVKKSLVRPGMDYKRQISGSMKRRQVIQPYLCSELIDEEHKDWWQQYDV